LEASGPYIRVEVIKITEEEFNSAAELLEKDGRERVAEFILDELYSRDQIIFSCAGFAVESDPLKRFGADVPRRNAQRKVLLDGYCYIEIEYGRIAFAELDIPENALVNDLEYQYMSFSTLDEKVSLEMLYRIRYGRSIFNISEMLEDTVAGKTEMIFARIDSSDAGNRYVFYR
jgi:hypothetical protein